MSVVQKLTDFVVKVFKTNLEIFYEALRLSPSAQGYVHGSVSELLLKHHLEKHGFDAKRIREKWEGKKHSRHHGDFYIRKGKDKHWFVLESKGVKSNSEKWHKLYNLAHLSSFLHANSDKINWIEKGKAIEPQITTWIEKKLPKFAREYRETLYDYEEIQKYSSKRETEKSQAMSKLRKLSRDEVAQRIRERLQYVMSRVRVLETHFPVGISGSSLRTQATPRKDEFNLVSIDIVLRYHDHKFLFASPQNLASSGDDPNHLQQNYILGFVFVDDKGNETLSVDEEWREDFIGVFADLKPSDAITEADMQVDNRLVVLEDQVTADDTAAVK